jgi:Putative Actinobacterial Holin-X, holin superfamily III
MYRRMSETRTGPAADTLSAQSMADLVKRASEQISVLVRDELALAKAEVTRKASHAGLGVGLFGGAGLVSLYGVFGVLTGIVLLLARVMPAWGAALLVGVVLLIVAGLLALVGRSQVRQASPPVPEEAVRGVRADIETVTTAVEERGHRG